MAKLISRSMILFWLVSCSQIVLAQVTTATISGTVADSTGAVLPGASVVMLNQDTGISRTVQTDAAGRYTAPSLSLGRYQVSASVQGFQTEVRTGIVLTVGRQAVVNFELPVGAITQTVEVTGEAPLVDTTSSAITGLVDDKVMRDLPLNGRSFAQLTTLQLGVTISKYAGWSGGGGGGIFTGKGQKYSVAGARPQQSSFLLDGSDVNDAWNNTPGSVAGVMMGVESVREFKAHTSTFSAELGRSAGGVISAVTKSGTNELHGSVYEFLRNSALDAKNFFDRLDKPIPAFKRNQFGFALGGPIKRNRTFFFGNYEALRDRLGLSQVSTVPAAEVHEGRLRGQPITIHPNIKPYLALYPRPNGRDFGDGTAELLGSGTQPIDENFFVVRFDQQLSDKDSFFVRYNFDDSGFRRPQNLPLFENVQDSRNQYLTIETTRVATPTLLNTARFGFNRSYIDEVLHPLIDIPASLNLSPVMPFGVSGTMSPGSGIASLGGGSVAPSIYAYNLFEGSDDVSYVRGRHSLKTGVTFKRVQLNFVQWFHGSGSYSFSSLPNFLRGDPSDFTAVVPGGNPQKGWRQIYVGTYLQDDFRVTPKLTLNLGLRWEVMTGPQEVNGRAANYDDDLGLEHRVGNPFFPTISKKGFQPRFGFAWDTWGNGKTSVRGGFGLFHDQPFPVYWHVQGFLIQPWFARVTGLNPPFPGGFEYVTGITPRYAPDSASYSKIPYMMQYNLSVQQEITRNTVFTVGYSGSRGVNLVVGRDFNSIRVPTILPDGTKFFPKGAPLVIPHLDRYRRSGTAGDSWYNALLLGVKRSYSQGLQFQVSYTFSKSMDTGSQFNSGEFPNSGLAVDPFDLRREKSLSSFHTKHNFVTSYTYDLPFGPGRPFGRDLTGAAEKIVGGWGINGVVTVASGTPFTLNGGNCRCDRSGRSGGRANVVAGRSNNPVLGGPDQYFDVTAFEAPPYGVFNGIEGGFLGNLGRNPVVGPGLATFDLSLVKNTPISSISEAFNIQFKAEFFNLFNRPNFGLPNHTIFTGAGRRVGGAARITNTMTTSRQIQFALKLIF